MLMYKREDLLVKQDEKELYSMKSIQKYLIVASLLVGIFMTVACGNKADTASTVGETMKARFQTVVAENPNASVIELSDLVLEDKSIPFQGGSMGVEPGLLTGFGNTEITGFDAGVMFGPVIGSIPFVGYIFELSEGTDAKAFMDTLKQNADLRWNVCTEADEVTMDQNGQKVFFLMAPTSFEE